MFIVLPLDDFDGFDKKVAHTGAICPNLVVLTGDRDQNVQKEEISYQNEEDKHKRHPIHANLQIIATHFGAPVIQSENLNKTVGCKLNICEVPKVCR